MDRSVKSGERPNAAPRSAVSETWKRMEKLGLATEQIFVERSGLSRSTFFRFKKLDMVTSSLKDVDEWLTKEEHQNPKIAASQSSDARLREWSELGDALFEADPERFAEILEAVRVVLKARHMERDGLSQILRGNPDRRR